MSKDTPKVNEEFYKKLGKLSFEDLKIYERSAIILGRSISALAISILLLMLFYPLISVVFVCVCAVYFLAHVHAGVTESIMEIRKNIARFE